MKNIDESCIMNIEVINMIYLDYSATTPVSRKVLEEDALFHQRSFANCNSIHALGKAALEEVDKATNTILDKLNLKDYSITYTSGATESNNLALKGIAYINKEQGKHIITTAFEHGSIVSCLNYLANQGFEIDIVDIDDQGQVDLRHLQSLITDQTILVSIGAVNSELGIIQDLKKIKDITSQYPNITFHSDMTQAVGKIKTDFSVVDLLSFSGHKIYGFKGIGALIHRKNIDLRPLIHGGKSLSKYRGGTPPTSLIYSLAIALEDIYKNFEEKEEKVKKLNLYLRNQLKTIKNVFINSPMNALANILNFSLISSTSHQVQKYLSDKEIYVSTTSACSSNQGFSRVVKVLTKDDLRSQSSIRVSISHLSEKTEIDALINALEAYDESC